MKPAEKDLAWALVVGMVIGLIGGPANHTTQAAEQTGETSSNVESATPTWSGGAAVGFLSNTPDGTAFAFNRCPVLISAACVVSRQGGKSEDR